MTISNNFSTSLLEGRVNTDLFVINHLILSDGFTPEFTPEYSSINRLMLSAESQSPPQSPPQSAAPPSTPESTQSPPGHSRQFQPLQSVVPPSSNYKLLSFLLFAGLTAAGIFAYSYCSVKDSDIRPIEQQKYHLYTPSVPSNVSKTYLTEMG